MMIRALRRLAGDAINLARVGFHRCRTACAKTARTVLNALHPLAVIVLAAYLVDSMALNWL
jgi:hypothetical protein